MNEFVNAIETEVSKFTVTKETIYRKNNFDLNWRDEFIRKIV